MIELFYGAGEAVLGIATGVLVRGADGAPAAERAGAAAAVQALWDDFVTGDLLLGVGAVAWILAVLAAAVAFRRIGAPVAVPVLLVLSGLVAFHPSRSARSACSSSPRGGPAGPPALRRGRVTPRRPVPAA